MDFGNAIAEALRRRTAARVYGTPFYETELARRAQAVQGGDLANQTAQFKLGQEQALAPGELEQQGLKTTGLQTANELATAKSQMVQEQAAGYAAAQQAANDLKEAQAELARAKGPAAQTVAQARLMDAQAKMHKALNPTPGGSSFSPVAGGGVDENGQPVFLRFNKQAGTYEQAPTAAPVGGGAAGLIRPKPSAETAQTRNRRDQALVLTDAGNSILRALQDPKLRAQLGPARGRAGQMMEKIGILSPEVRNFRTGLKSFSSLLPILHGFRGGTQMASQFEHMVGDINQGPEQIEAAVKNIMQLAQQIQSPKDNPTGAPGGAEEWVRDANGKLVKKQ